MKRAAVLLPLLFLAGCSWTLFTPSPRVGLATRPCRASHLHASLFLQGATGSAAGPIIVRNTGKVPCSFPSVIARAHVAKTGVRILLLRKSGDEAFFDGAAPPGLVSALRRLAPGQAANALFAWGNFCGKSPPKAIVLQLRGGTRLHISLDAAPRCDAPGHTSLISISRFSKRTS
jgi:hypothetical protein